MKRKIKHESDDEMISKRLRQLAQERVSLHRELAQEKVSMHRFSDEDTNFFMAMADMVKQFPSHIKNKAKFRIHQLIFEMGQELEQGSEAGDQ